MLQKTLYFYAFVYQILFSRIKVDLLSTLSISAIQNTQIIMLRVNSVGMTSACDPASIFACPQCGMHHLVYMRYLWVLRGYYEFSRAVFLISEARLKNAGTIFERSTVANDISPRLLLTYLSENRFTAICFY